MRVCVCTAADLRGSRFPRHVRRSVDAWRRLTGRQLPETERSATEGLQGAKDRRVADETSEDLLLSVRTPD